MKTNILATAVALSDQDLLARLHALARTERETIAELVAHLTALELRPSLYLADGYGSLFDYCTRALGLSEDAACSRIKIVRACNLFPVILDHLFAGELTLTSVRLLAPHLTAENHEAVLARARNKRRQEIETLVAELAPRPDVPASVRKLPAPTGAPLCMSAGTDRPIAPNSPAPPLSCAVGATPTDSPDVYPAAFDNDQGRPDRFVLQAPSPDLLRHRPIVQALSPQRYRVQFTIGQASHDDLRTVQALLRREIPNGDPGAIFERALALLRKEVEKAKLGVGTKPRRTGGGRRQARAYENRIRFRTDHHKARDPSHDGSQAVDERTANPNQVPKAGSREGEPPPMRHEPSVMRREQAPSRHISNAVKRVVWYRDRGQCAFVSASGRRCAERSFLELHHIQPYALEGPATAENIALRCRRHNQYEAELIFGPHAGSRMRLRDRSDADARAPRSGDHAFGAHDEPS